MKKSGIQVLLLVTVLFLGFLAGFFLGRNMSHGDIQISALTPTESANETKPAVTTPTSLPAITTVPAAIPAEKININTAGKEALMQLPGIGEVLAMNILNYRNEHGPFTAISDLLNVDGIGEKRLDAIWDMITLGG